MAEPPPMSQSNVEAIAEQMQKLSTQAKLLAAMSLIDMGKPLHAETFVQLALDDLVALRVLGIQRVPLF